MMRYVVTYRFVCALLYFFLMIRRPRRSTRTDTLFPYATVFRARIASALLISLISDGFKYAGEKHGPTSTTHYGNGAVVEEPFESNTARTIQRLADQAVERSANRPATVTINQGTVLNVYVAQDIDFTGVLPRIN